MRATGAGAAQHPSAERRAESPARYTEPFSRTVRRTGSIALVAGAALWIIGDYRHQGTHSLVALAASVAFVLWISLGGHYVELFYLNLIRRAVPAKRWLQTLARVSIWAVGGAALFACAEANRQLILSGDIGDFGAVWLIGVRGSVIFVGIELIAHALLRRAGQPNIWTAQVPPRP